MPHVSQALWTSLPEYQLACRQVVQMLEVIEQLFHLDVGLDPRILLREDYFLQATNAPPVPHSRVYRSPLSHLAPLYRRQPRFIFTALAFTAIASGVGGFALHSLFGGNDDSRLIHKLNVEANDLHILEKDVRINNRLLASLASNASRAISQVRLEEEILEQCNLCSMHAANVNRYSLLVQRNLDRLSRHLIPYDLVQFRDLSSNLPLINRTLGIGGACTTISSVKQLYNLKASYAVKAGVLHFYLHLPVTSAPRLRLFEYVPVPLIHYVSSGPTAAIITPKERYLAISEGEVTSATTYMHLSSMDTCSQEDGGIWSCPFTPVLRRNLKDSCLIALFTRNIMQMHATCQASIYDPPFFAVQLTHDQFFFYAQRHEIGNVKCGRKDTSTFTLPSGKSLVQVPPHCSILVGDVELYAQTIDTTEDLVTLAINPYFPQELLEKLPREPEFKFDPGKYGNLIDIPEEDFAPLDIPAHFWVTMAGVVGLAAVVVILICCYVWRSKKGASSNTIVNISPPTLSATSATPVNTNPDPPAVSRRPARRPSEEVELQTSLLRAHYCPEATVRYDLRPRAVPPKVMKRNVNIESSAAYTQTPMPASYDHPPFGKRPVASPTPDRTLPRPSAEPSVPDPRGSTTSLFSSVSRPGTTKSDFVTTRTPNERIPTTGEW